MTSLDNNGLFIRPAMEMLHCDCDQATAIPTGDMPGPMTRRTGAAGTDVRVDTVRRGTRTVALGDGPRGGSVGWSKLGGCCRPYSTSQRSLITEWRAQVCMGERVC